MSVEKLRPTLRGCIRWHVPAWLVVALSMGLSHSLGLAQSLSEIYRKAQVEDTQYRAARKLMEATLEKLPQARAGLLPTVNLNANNNKQAGEVSFSEAPFLSRDVNSWGWTAQLTQPLIRWSNWHSFKQAGAQVAQARAQFFLAEQDLIVRATQSYLDVMVARESILVTASQLNAVQEQLLLATRNFEVGTGIITDVHEARARWALALSQNIAANNELTGKLAELEKILGEPPPIATGRLIHMPPMLKQDALQQWLGTSSERNPQILIAQAAVEVAEKEVSKNSSIHLPTMDLTLNRAGNYSSGSLSSPAELTSRAQSAQVGVQLTLPLYAGGGTQSRVRESLLLLAKAQDDLLGAKRSASSQVRLAFAGVLNGQAQIEALQAAVEAGERAVEANKIGFKVGTRINPDVLNAEQQFYASKRDLTKARVDLLMQWFRLKAAAGELQQQDIASVDALIHLD